MKIIVHEAQQSLVYYPKTRPVMSEAEALRRAMEHYAQDFEDLKDR